MLVCWSMFVDKQHVHYFIRFGSVISGAIKSKLSASKGKSGETKGSVEKGKRQRGSFSFHGGMQVPFYWATFLPHGS